MQTSSLCPSYPGLFNLIDQEAIRLLDAYLYKQIRNIPHPMRFNIINKHNNNNLQCFLNLYYQNFLDNYEKATSNNSREYTELADLYETMVSITGAIASDSISKENFDIRCRLIEGVLDASTENIGNYLDGSPIKFHLFRFLFEIIFNRLDLAESKREILKHRFGYSDRYEKLTKAEMAERLSITKSSVYLSEQSLERSIRDVIRVFKVFSPYYSYKSKYLSDKEIVIIGPAVFDCIRKEEGEEGMTDAFIVEVLSVIYNYKMIADNTEGKKDYCLIRIGNSRNKMIRFGYLDAERN
jgi:hypothetical protein